MFNRREFLRLSSLISLAPTIPGFLAHTARAAESTRDGRILVVIQLDGGNDGINTVVPYADEGYAKCRDALRLPADRLHKITKQVGLHPAMGAAAKLFESERFAVVQGVGYPNPSRSHFKSMAIWHSANVDLPKEEDKDAQSNATLGWIGQALDEGSKPADGSSGAMFVGSGAMPGALRSRRSVATAMTRPEDSVLTMMSKPRSATSEESNRGDLASFVQRSTLDAYASSERMAKVLAAPDKGLSYPATGISGRLRTIAQIIKGGAGTRVYYTSQGAYDTHAVQLDHHSRLLRELADGMKAFVDDLTAAKLADRVLVMCFSEFGRRANENGSQGTDHGSAGPVLLAGPGVRAGVVGETPKLLDLVDGDLKITVDFRQVYASILEDWLGLPSEPVLGKAFVKLPLFRN